MNDTVYVVAPDYSAVERALAPIAVPAAIVSIHRVDPAGSIVLVADEVLA
jgi:hypothetical protein